MKIKQITLQGFKKFTQAQTFSFLDEDGEINETTLILGANGSGKTSILQAIVLLLANTAQRDLNIEELNWGGFQYKYLASGNLPKISADFQFTNAELEATKKYAEQIHPNTKIGNLQTAILNWDFKQKKSVAVGGSSVFWQFCGYQYAKQLNTITTEYTQLFESVGTVYWYTEQRNSNDFNHKYKVDDEKMNHFRRFLADAYNFHIAVSSGKRKLREGQFDFYERLKKNYELVFSNKKLVGSAPDFSSTDTTNNAPEFFFADENGKEYELGSMSAGERAIFPILVDFARLNINNSIIIIDEIELHLHISLQQDFIKSLLKLGKNNQFIFTSHSSSVVAFFDESQIIRLDENGKQIKK